MKHSPPAFILAVAACSAPAASTELSNRGAQALPPAAVGHVTLAPYGDIALDDGAFAVMDHNNGDQRVYVVTITRDFRGTKLSWDDKPGPRSELRPASFPIDAQEHERIRSWLDPLWQAASPKLPAARAPGTMYEWAIALRRGDEIRVLEGVAGGHDPEPLHIEEIVDFLDMQF